MDGKSGDEESGFDCADGTPVKILLVEDNAADVRLTREALKEGKVANRLDVVGDGVEAMAYLRRQGKYAAAAWPDLILLDLNLPRMNGMEVLAEIKRDSTFKRVPVVILTTSDAEHDILKTYDLHANCYITKPIGLNKFMDVVKLVEEFWFTIVQLPPPPQSLGV